VVHVMEKWKTICCERPLMGKGIVVPVCSSSLSHVVAVLLLLKGLMVEVL
jgi:hypothetical protein